MEFFEFFKVISPVTSGGTFGEVALKEDAEVSGRFCLF
jgi:hypothetical protein